MSHQKAICELLYKILNMDDEAVIAFSRGNPFDKLLRSYDEFTSNGYPLYRKDRGQYHYKFSEKAFHSSLTAKDLYGEHRIPLKIIKNMLVESSRTLSEIQAIMRSNEVVLITREEQRLLDLKPPHGLGLRSKLPPCGTDRLIYAGIYIAEATLTNRL